MKMALFGPAPFIVLVVVDICSTKVLGGISLTSIVMRIVILALVLPTMVAFGGFYVWLTGIVSGWIAHQCAFETEVSVSRLAIAIAWVINLSLWGGVVVVAIVNS